LNYLTNGNSKNNLWVIFLKKINTNVNLSAQNNLLKSSNASLNHAMQRLSSGKRINGASDDAAGMSISTRLSGHVGVSGNVFSGTKPEPLVGFDFVLENEFYKETSIIGILYRYFFEIPGCDEFHIDIPKDHRGEVSSMVRYKDKIIPIPASVIALYDKIVDLVEKRDRLPRLFEKK
jgi:hypothetical protein